MTEHRGACVKVTCFVLALATGAGAAACDSGHGGPATAGSATPVLALPAKQGPPHPASLRSASCFLGYVRQSHSGAAVSTFSAPVPYANGYEVILKNKGSSQSATVSSVAMKFFGSSGAQIASYTVPLLTLHVPPGQSLTVTFYGPNSGYVTLGTPVPGEWVSDPSMPAGARQCQVAKW